MKILADMPISPLSVEFLRKMDIECHHVTEFKLETATDEEIISFAKEKGFTILTEDLDFGTILAYTKDIEPSILILRVGNLNTNQINQILANALPKIKDKKNCIIVIERSGVRIRYLPIKIK